MQTNETDLKVFQKEGKYSKGFLDRLFQSKFLNALALTIFPPHLLYCSLSHRCRDYDKDVPT